MAQGKKSFVLYSDLLQSIEHLTNEEKGILFTHLLEYVNDMNPILNDRLLLTALQILNKYGNPKYPTHCEHDVLHICGIEPENISEEDKLELSELGFEINIEGVYDEENDYTPSESIIYSYRFGSV